MLLAGVDLPAPLVGGLAVMLRAAGDDVLGRRLLDDANDGVAAVDLEASERATILPPLASYTPPALAELRDALTNA